MATRRSHRSRSSRDAARSPKQLARPPELARLSGVARDRLPDFLGIGAQKAGTTWLFENLRRHPDLYLPPEKEVHFFDRPGERSLRDYAARFNAGKGRVRGEITPAYASLPRDTVRFIHALMPDLRLVLLLRDPVERAWSQAVMELSLRRSRPVSSLSRTEVIDFFSTELSRSRSDYLSILDTWLDSYREEQLLVASYDDIVRRPRRLLKRVFAHLGASTRVTWDQFPFREVIVPNIAGGLRPGRFAKHAGSGRAAVRSRWRSQPCPAYAARWLSRVYRGDLRELERRLGAGPRR